WNRSLTKQTGTLIPPHNQHLLPQADTRTRNAVTGTRSVNTSGTTVLLSLPSCSGAHVLEFLRYLDQFGKTKVHHQNCAFFGLPNPPAPCPCPLRQAWGSLDALIGRLRAAYEENGGPPEANPFGSRAVRLYLREVRDFQAKARGVSYDKKRKRVNRQKTQTLPQTQPPLPLQQQQPHQGQSVMANYSGATV
ncbi:unnamed protein product, partial [Brassica rapa]